MTDMRSSARPNPSILIAAFAIVIALQAYLVFAKSINWDEFFHFHHIYELRSGTMTRALQAIYIQYSGWLFDLPIDPIDQLLVGRAAMLVCGVLAAGAVFGLASEFCSRLTAALCALAYLTGGYVFLHGFAYRGDPQATALLMGALWLFCSRRLSWWVMGTIALMVALAAMITIKAVFYAPAFLGIFYLRLHRSEDVKVFVWRCAAIGVLAGLFFILLFALHGSTLAKPPVQAGQGAVSSAWQTVFSAGLLPQAKYLLGQITYAPHLTAMLVISPFLWKRRFPTAAERAAMIGLLLPVATIFFYRNSYPYNFVFILAPAAVTIIPAVEWLVSRFGAYVCGGLLVLHALWLTTIEPKETLRAQRSISSAVHEIFPEPVTYIDFCGFVGHFPRALPFLTSGWGLQSYRLTGQPRLSQAMGRQPIPLLIVNHPVLAAAVSGRRHEEMLLPVDAAAVRDNYVPHWGPIWVAGKRIEAGAGAEIVTFAVPGVYTVEGAAIVIDGTRLKSGDTVRLGRGRHRIVPNPQRSATLRWGDHLPVPKRPPPEEPHFTLY